MEGLLRNNQECFSVVPLQIHFPALFPPPPITVIKTKVEVVLLPKEEMGLLTCPDLGKMLATINVMF